MLQKQTKRIRRHRRVRSKVIGTSKVPRLCVFKSNQHIYAQLIDDDKNKTILSVKDGEVEKGKIPSYASSLSLRATAGKQNPKDAEKVVKGEKGKGEQKKEIPMTVGVVMAYEVGKLVAEKAKEKKISKVVFDRGGYSYHGKIKALAQGAREGGLQF